MGLSVDQRLVQQENVVHQQKLWFHYVITVVVHKEKDEWNGSDKI